jgi:cytochrome o ubiquinol oxidase subunit 3
MHSETIEVIENKIEPHHDTDSTDVFGFWLYIMTDCILFASLFATYIVLDYPHSSGPDLKNYLYLPDVLIETFFLLLSNFTFGLAMINTYKNHIANIEIWLAASFLLGLSFILMEVKEFIHLAEAGFRWDINAKASSFFTLVGTHGLHVSCGLIWILLLMIQIPLIRNRKILQRRITYLGLFWNFLDIIWIFVFTIVYLRGAI